MTATPSVLVPPPVASLTPWIDSGALGRAEVHFAAWVARATGVDDPHVLLAAAVAVWAAREGHTCVHLPHVAQVIDLDRARRVEQDGASGDPATDVAGPLPWPSAGEWQVALRAHPAAVFVADPTVSAAAEPALVEQPLVLVGDRLYLQRHWYDERVVAHDLHRRAAMPGEPLSADAAALLESILPATEPDGSPNLQRRAAEAVLAHRVSMVVGGPGTGKTYSVARLLAALVAQAQEQGRALRIALAAPTGKAAARMKESIADSMARPDMVEHVPDDVRTQLAALEPTTIHRLLGPLAEVRQRFRHDAANQLAHDVVVVDEMSMVSLPLLARLCEAVREESRLVFIGDPDQLESVELGAVLADLVAASGVDESSAAGPLVGHAVRLLRPHRFEKDSPIALVADSVRARQVDETLHRLHTLVGGEQEGTLRYVDSDNPRHPDVEAAVREVVAPLLQEVRRLAEAGEAGAALDEMAKVRVLCAHREGPYGVSDWNRIAERWMCGDHGGAGAWYAGRPLLATRNDPRLGLANGDTGLVVRTKAGLRAAFRVGAKVTDFEPVTLDAVETAFAMTVHKSQGSEYPSVVLVLPPADSPLAGRELLYTAVTRAKRHLLVVANDEAVERCVSTSAARMTGLADVLR